VLGVDPQRAANRSVEIEDYLTLDVPQQRPTLEIRLFGSFELLESGRPLKFSGPLRAASLLAHLIVHRARPMSRDTIALAFWPDIVATAARANLRHISR
jgi:two-component SAPR family response regulator